MGYDATTTQAGLWPALQLNPDATYAASSPEMTDSMWREVLNTPNMQVNPQTPLTCISLGSPTTTSARHIAHANHRVSITCRSPHLDTQKNHHPVASDPLSDRVLVAPGPLHCLPADWIASFHACFAQDAFIPPRSQEKVFREACRATKGGGCLALSDLYCGHAMGPRDAQKDALNAFAPCKGAGDWQTAEQAVAAVERAGWAEARFVDLSAHMRLSFVLMLKKVECALELASHDGLSLEKDTTCRDNLTRQIYLVDEGMLKWGAIFARKPYSAVFVREPPVQPEPNSMICFETACKNNEVSSNPGADVLVITAADKLNAESVTLLPLSLRAIISMSAGADHIDMAATKQAGIHVLLPGSETIASSVADFLLATTICSLRHAFSKIGQPSQESDSSSSTEGVDLSNATIGIIGMGNIAGAFAKRLRKLSKCRVLYCHPAELRRIEDEARLDLEHTDMQTVLKASDIVIPFCAPGEGTAGLLDYSQFCMMKPTATLINAVHGNIYKPEGLARALREGKLSHAFLDTSEGLPMNHELYKLPSCTVTPHLATNTSLCQKEMVKEVSRLILSTLDGKKDQADEEESLLRKDLSIAHVLTRKYGMDHLIWTHISARMSDRNVLLTPGNMLFDEIKPEDIQKSSANVTADIIHKAVYASRPDVRAIVHLHTAATVAVSCLKDGFQCVTQSSALFYKRVAYYDWQGISDEEDEGPALSAAVSEGEAGQCHTLLMRNHGFCTFGKTVAEAWTLAYFFEISCVALMEILKSGQEINRPDPKVMAFTAKKLALPKYTPGECEWPALERLAACHLRSSAATIPNH